jgi:hypothetical protein
MFIRLAMLCLLACVGLARAQGTLEVIPLHNRTVEEVMPSLRPLLEPGGTLTGMQGKLILRASDANRAEIKQVLAALDTIPRQLTITVRQSLNRSDTRQSAELFGKVDGRHVDITLPPGGAGGAQLEIAGDSARIGARLDDRSLDQISRVSQHLRVADGGRALIHASVEMPYTLRERVAGPHGAIERESVVFRSVGSGFHVEPHVVGERVTLDIHPVKQTFGASPHVIEGQSLRTTVSGRLGEWIVLGGGDSRDQQTQRRLLGSRQGESRETRQVWLKVEAAE